jgi:hypothetical protein
VTRQALEDGRVELVRMVENEAEVAGPESFVEGVDVDELHRARVDPKRSGRAPCEYGAIDQAEGRLGERQVNGDRVRARRELVELLPNDSQRPLELGAACARPIADFGAEAAAGHFGDALPDPAEADDAEALPPERRASRTIAEIALSGSRFLFFEASQALEQRRNDELRHAVGAVSRHIRNADAALRRRFEIHATLIGAENADVAQPGRPLEQGAIGGRSELQHQPVGIVDFAWLARDGDDTRPQPELALERAAERGSKIGRRKSQERDSFELHRRPKSTYHVRVQWVMSDDGSMSGDETLVLVAATGFTLIYFARFYAALRGASRLYKNAWQIRLLGLTPPLLVALLFRALLSWADPIVRESLGYLLLFSLVGAAWMAVVLRALSYFGLSFRDDVVEARNPAAATVVVGALIGIMLSFAGSNVGSGPTIWTTLIPAVLALGVFLAALWLLELVAHPSEAVTLDRDPAAGVRLAGFLVATGAILGRSAAGDFRSFEDTVAGIARGAALVFALVAVAAIAHRKTQPTPTRPAPELFTNGVLVASAFVGASATWVWVSLPIR